MSAGSDDVVSGTAVRASVVASDVVSTGGSVEPTVGAEVSVDWPGTGSVPFEGVCGTTTVESTISPGVDVSMTDVISVAESVVCS